VGERPLTPDAEARLLADVAGIEAQIEHHRAVLEDPAQRNAQGRGFVAAEDKGAGLSETEIEALMRRIDSSPDHRQLHEKMIEQARGGKIDEARAIRQQLADKLGVTTENLQNAIEVSLERAVKRALEPKPLTKAEAQSLREERARAEERSRELDQWFVSAEQRKEILRSVAEEIQADRNTQAGPGEFADRLLNERIDQIVKQGQKDAKQPLAFSDQLPNLCSTSERRAA